MVHTMTVQELEALTPGANSLAISGMAALLGLTLNLPGRRVRFEVEGFERLSKGRVIFAMNHTHRMDWLVLRLLAKSRGRMLCNWVKPRTYEEGMAFFLNHTGNVPLASRGYLVSADVRQLTGRVPTDAEYRALRNHLDHGLALPKGELYRRVAHEPRDLLGMRFDPQSTSWRDAMEALFARFMQATLRHTRRLNKNGSDLVIMPQGITHMRLTSGHPGALQASLALGLPLVPVGISGFPQVLGKNTTLPARSGTVRVRLGAPYHPAPIAGHQPFVPASERAHADALDQGTGRLMRRINRLLDPVHQWDADPEHTPTDVNGVARFI